MSWKKINSSSTNGHYRPIRVFHIVHIQMKSTDMTKAGFLLQAKYHLSTTWIDVRLKVN